MSTPARCIALALLTLLAARAVGAAPVPPFEGDLEAWLRAQPERFGAVLDDPQRFRLQIIYTRIDRDGRGGASFRSHTYRVDASEYFYPASTVKLPAALVALETLDRWDIPGLDADTTMLTGAAGPGQSPVHRDPLAPDGRPTVAGHVRAILRVSDNEAFNRLYELIGQEALNATLASRGYAGVRIVHRLESPLDFEANRYTNPVRFVDAGRTVYAAPARYADTPRAAPAPIRLGRAEIIDGVRIQGPKDFATKNALPLQALHDMVQALVFPDAVPAQRRWLLAPATRARVLREMSGYPGDAGVEAWNDPQRYPEGYVKFLMYGGSASEIPDAIRIFNKVGDAYGFLTDAAYVVDLDAGVEFLLAATIHTNANGTFNDNVYEYEQIGLPFLADLGSAVYAMERRRERVRRPDFDDLRGILGDR